MTHKNVERRIFGGKGKMKERKISSTSQNGR